MLLIKLSYLQQAIELQQNDAGLGKKKLTDNAKPVAFRALPVLRIKNEPAAAAPQPVTAKKEASLVIETPAPVVKKEPVAVKQGNPPQPVTPAASLSSLKKLRESIAQKNNKGTEESIPLSPEKLQTAWNEYIEILRNNKSHSSVTIFGMAVLNVVDDNSFEITVENDMQYKFIEAERAGLVDHFTQKFRNRSLTYQLLINKSAIPETEPVITLNSRQKFQLIAEQYPNVKLLKEKLRLDIG